MLFLTINPSPVSFCNIYGPVMMKSYTKLWLMKRALILLLIPSMSGFHSKYKNALISMNKKGLSGNSGGKISEIRWFLPAEHVLRKKY